jgi:vacuolar-type H+-ATPase subunit I/STV1
VSEEKTTKPAEESQPTSSEAWEEVGKQFQALGESLAAAFRVAVHKEENRRRVQEMQSGLEAMVNEVGKAIKESAASPQVQQVRSEAEKAAESLRVAGEQTVQEVRPHLLSALHQVNAELQKMISRMEEKPPEKPASGGQGPEPPASG